MGPNGPHDMPPMGPPGMMQNFSPDQAMGPPGGGPGRNFYDNFYQQQGMGMEDEDEEGTLAFFPPIYDQNGKPSTIFSCTILSLHFYYIFTSLFWHTDENYMEGDEGNFNEEPPANQNPVNTENAGTAGPANQSGITVPDFLPPAQRVLFMRIQQKQQEEEERARRLAEGGPERDNEGTFNTLLPFTQGNCVK